MVYPIPDDRQLPPHNTVKANNNSIRRRKKKTARKARREVTAKNKDRFVVSMSSWAEQFTAAATWQIKHQLAYWKAKAISLEYENKILHDIIRQNCSDTPKSPSQTTSETDFRDGPVPKMYARGPEPSESEASEDYEEECEKEEEEENWEVSEEYIEFLMKNAKFKEDARCERERLKAKQAKQNEVEILEAGPSQPVNLSAEMKELYGTNWQKIVALEMSVQSNFINESDKIKPSYWPNIPLNFG